MIIGFFYSKKESSAESGQVVTPSQIVTPIRTQLTAQATTNKSLDTDQTPSTQSPNTNSGLIAYISPVTGELTTQPSAKQSFAETTTSESATSNQQAGIQQQSKELPPIKYTTYENGMIRAQLNGHFMVPQTASVDCNGELHTKHAERLEVAETCVNK